MSDHPSILRFDAIGERATRRILRGWCGPLVPEPPSDGYDHRKSRLMYMDCTSPETLEGHVLTFTHSQWSQGTELVFEDGAPRGVGADPAVGRRVLSWSTCWKWIERAGMDCTRPEVQARLNTLCAAAIYGQDRAKGVYAVEVEPHGRYRTLTYRLRSTAEFAPQALWGWVESADGFMFKSDLWGAPYATPILRGPAPDAACLTASLTFSLAPRIAALQDTPC